LSATAIQQTKDGDLSSAASSPMEFRYPFRLVHIAGESTDIGFVHFDRTAFAAEDLKGLALHRKSNSVHHEPCTLLRDAKCTMHFIRTHSILRAADQPYGGKPLGKRDGRVFKDRPSLDRKLFLALKALPDAACAQIARALLSAVRAYRLTVRPTQIGEEFNADIFIREVF